MKLALAIGITLLILEFESVFAQTIYPRVGVTFSAMTYDPPTADVLPSASFTVGLGGEIHLGKILDLYIECDYVSRNFRYQFESGGGTYTLHYEAKIRQKYVDVPVMVRRYFGPDRRFYVNGGGYVGFEMGGMNKGESWSSNQTDARNNLIEFSGWIKYGPDPVWDHENDLYYTNKVDVGIVIGGGVMLAKMIMLDFRYGMGLIDIDEDYDDYKNRVFQLAISVPLKLSPLE
jgi:hypothetical protein